MFLRGKWPRFRCYIADPPLQTFPHFRPSPIADLLPHIILTVTGFIFIYSYYLSLFYWKISVIYVPECNSFKNWMLILVLLCENERQRWDASRYITARSEAKRFKTVHYIKIIACRIFYYDLNPFFFTSENDVWIENPELNKNGKQRSSPRLSCTIMHRLSPQQLSV